MEKTKGKRKTQDSLITSVIGVSAVIAFMGGYVLSGDLTKSYNNLANSNNKVQKLDGLEIAGASVSGSTLAGSTLGFNENYIVASDEYDYNYDLGTYAGVGDSYVTFQYGNKKNEIKIVKYYYDNDESEEYTVSFDKNVVDIHMSTFDMNTDLSTILFLLDDGSVEYMFIENAMERDVYNTEGKIEELKNITKFYEGTACEKGTPICTKTTFAQSIDGKIYNLYDYIG